MRQEEDLAVQEEHPVEERVVDETAERKEVERADDEGLRAPR